jgi:hypothetical protein
MAAIIAFVDRIIPFNVRRFGGKDVFPSSDSVFWRRYGFVRFPRTALGLLVVASIGVNLVIPLKDNIQIFVTTFAIIIYVISVGVDIIKSR